jgi:hypothetical protein
MKFQFLHFRIRLLIQKLIKIYSLIARPRRIKDGIQDALGLGALVDSKAPATLGLDE